MHRAEQYAVLGGQCVQAFRRGAVRRHRLFDQDMDAAADRGGGQFEMGLTRRANVQHVDLGFRQYLVQADTGVRTFEAARKTSRRVEIEIANRGEFAAGARDAVRMP